MMRMRDDNVKMKRSELRQVIENQQLLQDILANEQRALSSIESFLKAHPPSCLGEQAPEDMLG